MWIWWLRCIFVDTIDVQESIFSQKGYELYWLGVGFLQQSTPEFIVIFWVTVDELSVNCWQPVIDYNIHPLSKYPELEMEDSSIVLRLLWIPLLLFRIRDDL